MYIENLEARHTWMHGYNFSKSIGGGGGAEGEKCQGTIDILVKSDFSSHSTRFLAIMGGGGHSQRDIKLRHCVDVLPVLLEVATNRMVLVCLGVV